jgi:hypothetical protein
MPTDTVTMSVARELQPNSGTFLPVGPMAVKETPAALARESTLGPPALVGQAMGEELPWHR